MHFSPLLYVLLIPQYHHPSIDHTGAHPASYPMGTRSSYAGGKAVGSEPDHSPPSSPEVNNVSKYTSAPPIRLHSVVLSYKHRDKFYLCFAFELIALTILDEQYKL